MQTPVRPGEDAPVDPVLDQAVYLVVGSPGEGHQSLGHFGVRDGLQLGAGEWGQRQFLHCTRAFRGVLQPIESQCLNSRRRLMAEHDGDPRAVCRNCSLEEPDRGGVGPLRVVDDEHGGEVAVTGQPEVVGDLADFGDGSLVPSRGCDRGAALGRVVRRVFQQLRPTARGVADYHHQPTLTTERGGDRLIDAIELGSSP